MDGWELADFITGAMQKASGLGLAGRSTPGLSGLLWPLLLIGAILVFKKVAGKVRASDGKSQIQGLPALLQSISNLFNDKVDRDVKRASIARSNAETKRIEAEAEKVRLDVQRQNIENVQSMLRLAEKQSGNETQNAPDGKVIHFPRSSKE